MNQEPLHLFQACGVELEYMIVDAESLDVLPIADQVLRAEGGRIMSEVDVGAISWSNELALHVIELKTTVPTADLQGLPELFQDSIHRIGDHLASLGARLMPTAMHPWMDPERDLKLWPHEYNPVYQAYNRIFDCRGHGWANLQSVHLNLPFCGDQEFGRLHAAIRLLMPLMPALSASSPVIGRRLNGVADNRMQAYALNATRIPQVTGQLIPEPAFTEADYQSLILTPMYQAIAPLDPDGVLQHEWLNSRGAIARFDRNSIEVRVLDVQECPAADIAICGAITRVLQALVSERWTPVARQKTLDTAWLGELFRRVVQQAEQTVIDDREYLRQFGILADRLTAGELWRVLVDGIQFSDDSLEVILEQGSLAHRIDRGINGDLSRLPTVYRQLCDALSKGCCWIPGRP